MILVPAIYSIKTKGNHTRKQCQRKFASHPLCSSTVSCFAYRERYISVLDHMLNLSPHFINTGVSKLTRRNGFINYLLVSPNRMSQYITNTGQKTGKLNISNQLHMNPSKMALVAAYQNLNSGSLLTKGLNSSSCFVGSPPAVPSSIPSSCSNEGSNFGERNARNRFNK